MRHRWLIAALLVLVAAFLVAVGISRVQAPPPPLAEAPGQPDEPPACVWQWARQDAPEAAAQARAALESAGLASVQVERVEAYGENCLDESGNVRYFAAMTTDFYLTADVLDPTDAAALAGRARALYQALAELPEDALPARPGYLEVVVRAGDQERRLRAPFDALRQAAEASANDAEFLAILEAP